MRTATLRTATRTLTRCMVCGSTEIRTDEVIDRGIVLLAECSRCQHLWTSKVGNANHRVGPPADAAADAA